MAFDPVPWFVEGGAQHSAEVARLLAHMATGGAEGILNAMDLRCQALSVPADKVRVMPGACVIRNRSLGSENQSYIARMVVEDDTLAIPASGSSGPRTHLVVARVENPHISGEPWGAPADVETGPYIYPRVIPDVPITVRSVHELGLAFSAITLAKITVPTNTATITNSMITDLRSLVNPVSGPGTNPDNPPAEDDETPEVTEKTFFDVKTQSGSTQSLTRSPSSTWWHFPAQADWIIPIPEWATGADVYFVVNNMRLEYGGAIGEYRVNIDNGAVLTPPVVYDFIHNKPEPGWTRQQMVAAGTVAIPAALRGKAKRFKAEAKVTNDDDGTLKWTTGTVMVMQVVFKQQPIFG